MGQYYYAVAKWPASRQGFQNTKWLAVAYLKFFSDLRNRRNPLISVKLSNADYLELSSDPEKFIHVDRKFCRFDAWFMLRRARPRGGLWHATGHGFTGGFQNTMAGNPSLTRSVKRSSRFLWITSQTLSKSPLGLRWAQRRSWNWRGRSMVLCFRNPSTSK